jgi:hypothetical protein
MNSCDVKPVIDKPTAGPRSRRDKIDLGLYPSMVTLNLSGLHKTSAKRAMCAGSSGGLVIKAALVSAKRAMCAGSSGGLVIKAALVDRVPSLFRIDSLIMGSPVSFCLLSLFILPLKSALRLPR